MLAKNMSKEELKRYTQDIAKVFNDLEVDSKTGLTQTQAEERLKKYGENTFDAQEKTSALKILWHNVNNIVVYLLLFASALSVVMNDHVEAVAVLIAVLIAIVSGFILEYQSHKSLEALRKMITSSAKVIRNNKIQEIISQNVVPGDILYLEEGDSIVADGRIIETKNFATLESALTGESEAVIKDENASFIETVPLGDRKNMVYSGTAVTSGNAYIVVTDTGMNTEMGRISKLITEQKRGNTPLEKELDKLGKLLILFAGICGVLVFVIGYFSGYELEALIKISLILAIAAVPESLPAVSTITLARGMRQMSTQHALVKSLPAVETLGSTTVICTDKTGTLTENQMTATELYLPDGQIFDVEGGGFDIHGKILSNGNIINVKEIKDLNNLIKTSILSSNASLQIEDDIISVIGDPTEGGLAILGQKTELTKTFFENEGYQRIFEIPFDSSVMYMVTLYKTPQQTNELYVKGAPDVILQLTSLSDDQKEHYLQEIKHFTEKGLRVLAFAQLDDYKGSLEDQAIKEYFTGKLKFQGFIALMDPPREDVKSAIATAQNAGIKVIMITGDHPHTAEIIAKDIGIKNYEKSLSGLDLDNMDEQNLRNSVKNTSVYARVSPDNKLQLVNALVKENEIVAMTGDGVNDAPALNGSHIGIAMGIRGTEVAKEASDMILTDDNFSTIVQAVKEGRIIFDNIKKFISFLFASNIVEILAVILSMIAGIGTPVLPLQILWLNLIVNLLPALGLAWEPAEGNVMNKPPRTQNEGLINKSFLMQILTSGSLIGISAFIIFWFALNQGYSTEMAQTMSFTTMGIGQLLHIFNVRSFGSFGLNKSLLKNKFLIVSLIISVLLQLLAVYTPILNVVMNTVPLGLDQWKIILWGSIVPIIVIELYRSILNKK